jgi:uncharacterized protein (DUF697 family)
LPVTIPANLAAVLYIQVRMIAVIAHLRGYDLKSDKVKGFVLACLIGDGAVDAVNAAGIKFGMRVTENGIKAIPRAAIVTINRTVGVRLLTKAGSTGVVNLTKIIPVVGGLVCGSIDAAVTRTIGGAAKNIFMPIPTTPGDEFDSADIVKGYEVGKGEFAPHDWVS